MRIITYRNAGEPRLGVLTGAATFVAVHECDPSLPHTLDDLLQLPEGLARLRAAVHGVAGDRRLSDVALELPIQRPHAFWALALNFKTHIEETGLTTSAEFPQIFLRVPASFVAPGAPLVAPPLDVARAFDYEGELGVVIGRGGRHIPVDRALEHVAGYCAVNEGSVREFQRHNRQFGLGKNFEGSGSYGPWLMTADEFGNPAAQSLVTRLNGVERQRAPLDDMLFSVEQVINYLSIGYTLQPGDVIAMGTSGALAPAPDDTAGNDLALQVAGAPGTGRGNQIPGKVHMQPGDVVEVEITGLGVLRNPIVADLPATYRTAEAFA
jgi:2-keto-4-pentenoate hydratase/2-oxohepta-3-ene-1,7-dioic acid hydratase in catechol pathway